MSFRLATGNGSMPIACTSILPVGVAWVTCTSPIWKIWASLNSSVVSLTEMETQALLVDVRYNTGGYFSPLILEKLSRRMIGFNKRRWGKELDSYPPFVPPAVLVALANEYTGSDGDIFCKGFKTLGLGPLIGKRTWGGIVGISPRNPLVDNTVTTQPEIAFGFTDVGWGIENHGVDPDIEVENLPQDYAHAVDMQLERAILEGLRLLDQKASPYSPPPAPSRAWSPKTGNELKFLIGEQNDNQTRKFNPLRPCRAYLRYYLPDRCPPDSRKLCL